jgi:hypothetical protein
MKNPRPDLRGPHPLLRRPGQPAPVGGVRVTPRAPERREGESRAQDRYGNTAVVRANGTAREREGEEREQGEGQGRSGNAAEVRTNGTARRAGREEGGETEARGTAPAASEEEREKKERRLAQAASQLEAPPEVAVPPLLPPVAIPFGMPLSWSPAAAMFTAPPTPDFDTDRWQNSGPEQTRAIVDAARRHYESVAANARRRHDEMAGETNAALQAIADRHQSARSQLENEFLRADDSISFAFDLALRTLGGGAQAADRLILENYLLARDAISGASASMKKQIKANARTALTQIDDIIKGLAADFVGPLEEASRECTDASRRARSAVERWKAGISRRYPLDGDLGAAVENEAKLSLAPKLADNALSQISTKTTRITGRFSANVTQVNTDIRARVGPSLQAHAARIEPEGTAAVDTAFQKALSSLKRGANQARKAAAETHAQTVEQLVSLREAERLRLEAEMKAGLEVAQAEAQTAATTLHATATETLPRYGDAVEQLHGSMTQGAARGPQALQSVAGAAGQVSATLDQARDMQRQQIETVRSGVMNGLAAREMRAREENAASVAMAAANFDGSALATSDSMVEVAHAMTNGLTALSQGVIAAGQDWIRPLEEAFKQFLAEQKAELERGRPAFLGRVNTAKSEFLTWAAPQERPEGIFGPDLDAAAAEAKKKVKDAKHGLVRALDAGIIDVVNEEGVGDALRGLTRLQGQLLRSQWTKTWPAQLDHPIMRAAYRDLMGTDEYTLDGHLLLALGQGSDDYNAAINYLNGNTAEGARYELKASLHWYNDEESRIEGIMRGLTTEQLQQLHGLPGYKATRESVEDALGGTDLEVFKALDQGNHALADAHRMRDELNEARENDDDVAANDVLAKYSRAADYGGQRVSGAERRAAVQREFAHIQGVDLAAKAAEMARQREAEAARQGPVGQQVAPGGSAPAGLATAPTTTPATITLVRVPSQAPPSATLTSSPVVAPGATPAAAPPAAPVPAAAAPPAAAAAAPPASVPAPAPAAAAPPAPIPAPAPVAAAPPAPVPAPPAPAPAPATGAPTTAPAPAPAVGAQPGVPGTAVPGQQQPAQQPQSLADRWMTGQVAEPGAVVPPDGSRPSVSEQEAASQVLFEWATRDIRVPGRRPGYAVTYHEQEGYYGNTLTLAGRDRDLARALIFHGEGSPEARAAQLGVEMARSGKPDMLKVDSALVDPRLNPDLPVRDANVRRQIQLQALEERRQMLEIYARDYGGLPAGSTLDPSKVLINQLEQAFGSDTAGADLAARLVREDYPTPQTASRAMEYAIEGAGTNNELVDRTLGRMNRDEIATMRRDYKRRTGSDLYADLGVFGHGTFGDLSGDDRLRAERMLLGVPRNDRERAEVASFTIRQQREEAGVVGGWLAEGSLADIMLAEEETELNRLIGGPITFGPDGQPQWTDTSNFRDNEFIGNAGDFAASMVGAEMAAQNYSAKIDQYANFAAMGIAVLGAIAAAVVTVLTWGAASPLLLGAIAAISGLAAMGAQRLIKGGRYGWEDAVTDLGMTAVSALTAGVGQKLALASRGGVAAVQAASKTGLSISAARQVAQTPGLLGQMGRLTGSAYLDKVLIGVTTGGISSFGQAALTEETWKRGKGVENLFGATFRGMLGGGVTAGVTNAIEDMPLGRFSRFMGGKPTIGDAIGGSTSVVGRGLGKGITSSIGATAGRATELTFDRARGVHRMDAGEIFLASAEAGAMSFAQSFAEGGAEARAQAIYNARYGQPRPGAPPEPPVTRPPAVPEPARVPGVEEPGLRAPVPGLPELARPTTVAPEREGAGVRAAAPVEEPAAARRAAPPAEAPAVAPERAGAVPAAVPAEGVPADAARRILEGAVPVPPKEGAAAAIPGTRMTLAEAEALATPKSLHDAVDTAVTGVRALAGSEVEAEAEGARVIKLNRPDETQIRVRVVFGDTGGTDVANFRAARPEEGVDFVVTLSKRSHPDVRARAVAHELGELRVHGLEGHAAADLLTTREPGAADARLSAHDAGRLAELEVLASELATARATQGPESPAARGLQAEVDALAAHLGLLHAGTGDPRFVAAAEALGETSAARQALNEARTRASAPSLEDAFQPARRIDESTELSAADRKRLAELEELGARIDDLHTGGGPPVKGARLVAYNPRARLLELEAAGLLASMGLLGRDTASSQRARLAASVFEPDSPGARLMESLRRTTPAADADALRPGITPDERTVLSKGDLENIAELQASLRRLVDAEEANADPAEIARLRHQAEQRAAAMGLVHGAEAAERRTQFLLAHAGVPEASRLDAALAARLADVRRSAQQSPLLKPRFGTIDDLPLLAKQVAEARAMGDHVLADRLTEIAGFRLEDAGALHRDPDVQAQARGAVDRIIGDDAAARTLADDAMARHAERLNARELRAKADSARVTIGRLEKKLKSATNRATKGRKAGRAAAAEEAARLESEIELLHQGIRSLEEAAVTAERVAFRPGGRTADEARAAAAGDPGFPTAPHYRTDPDFAGAGVQQKLTRQMFGDSPLFQSWDRFRQIYAEINRTIRIGGTLSSGRTAEMADLERIFRHWMPGRHVGPEAPLGHFLPDSPIIRAVPGAEVKFHEPNTTTPVRLAADADVQVKHRTMTVKEAEAERRQLIDERNILAAKLLASNDATEQATIKEQINQLIARINDVSEALGEAAGLRFASTLPGGLAHVTVDRGSGVPDVIHIDPTTGRVTVIECKGGSSELGSRNVSETLGRAARAEQTTPEYLRDLATEMIGPGKSEASQKAGKAILEALDKTPPNIDCFVVRQPIDASGNRGSVGVTHYPVTRSGR